MSRLRQLCGILLLSFHLLAVFAISGAGQARPLVLVLTADGAVTPAMREYLRRGIRTAENRGVEALIFELNTPGGNIEPMSEMVQDIRESTVPVIVYIQPRGAMAASAGTIITLAGHAAAMAPETTIGAASPVGSEGQDLGTTLESKVKNILKAQARTLTERRGEKAMQVAQETVETAKALSAQEALEAGLIDFIAGDLDDLLHQLNGFKVETIAGEHTLDTTEATKEALDVSLIEQLLAFLTDPNIVFILLTLGVQAVIIELYSPGGWIAGFVGVVCIALAMYGLGVLPVNWFGLIFLVIAFVLFILDIKAPTHGALTAAGVGSLITGALVLFNSPGVPAFQRVSVPLVVGASMVSGLIFTGILIYALRAQKTPVKTGLESLIGRSGIARTEINPSGNVQLGGELWSAELEQGEAPIPAGSKVMVSGKKGIRLTVRKIE